MHAILTGLALGAGLAVAQTADFSFKLDAARVAGPWRRVDLYPNTSLRNAPPPELAATVEREYGRPKIVRVWLPLDDMWDYRTGQYTFNFQCGKDTYKDDHIKYKYDRDHITETTVHFEDYMRAFSQHSDELLLNVRRYEREVVDGRITMAQWKEVVKTGLLRYKKMFANLRYLEVLNEYWIGEFGKLDDDQYYAFYRVGYEIVNEVNQELKPALPLLVGGPCVVGKPFRQEDPDARPDQGNQGQRMYRFLDNYARDRNPAKKLDFISFHDYGLKSNVAAIADYQSIIQGWLRKLALPEDLPLFETEIGVAGPVPDAAENLRQATGVSSFFYYTRHNPNHYLFPWVLYHNPIQLSLVQFAAGLKMAPFGAAMKMWSMHKGNEVLCQRQDSGVGGPLAVASMDGSSLVVQTWNYSDKPVNVEIALRGLPARLSAGTQLRQYLVDAEHSNCIGHAGTPCELQMVNQSSGTTPESLKVKLEPHALALWKLEAPGMN
ncbi:hypothetical protein [uncultured Paludibaculum sp.]|uniref:hypothetical protein n=1 Tax=uncultured Paludibaculum sp. TaxID=1765020 RepID=UPI002AAB8894|nr:hypothetical protein [uncultured Paludibaculum sp.]